VRLELLAVLTRRRATGADPALRLRASGELGEYELGDVKPLALSLSSPLTSTSARRSSSIEARRRSRSDAESCFPPPMPRRVRAWPPRRPSSFIDSLPAWTVQSPPGSEAWP
jgi:hypothetical protein